ncbi:hypothetical protein LEP1GSC070_0042, partial [Leptospira santarosai str. AIM]
MENFEFYFRPYMEYDPSLHRSRLYKCILYNPFFHYCPCFLIRKQTVSRNFVSIDPQPHLQFFFHFQHHCSSQASKNFPPLSDPKGYSHHSLQSLEYSEPLPHTNSFLDFDESLAVARSLFQVSNPGYYDTLELYLQVRTCHNPSFSNPQGSHPFERESLLSNSPRTQPCLQMKGDVCQLHWILPLDQKNLKTKAFVRDRLTQALHAREDHPHLVSVLKPQPPKYSKHLVQNYFCFERLLLFLPLPLSQHEPSPHPSEPL